MAVETAENALLVDLCPFCLVEGLLPQLDDDELAGLLDIVAAAVFHRLSGD